MTASRCPLCGHEGGGFVRDVNGGLACPRCGEVTTEPGPKPIDVNGRALTAGTAVAGVGGTTLLASLVWLAAAFFTPPPPPPLPGQDPEAARGYRAAYYAGQYGPAIFGLALGTVQAAGGIQLARRKTWPIAVVGAITALLPCSCSFVVGLPIGIWALVVLFHPAVRASFQ